LEAPINIMTRSQQRQIDIPRFSGEEYQIWTSGFFRLLSVKGRSVPAGELTGVVCLCREGRNLTGGNGANRGIHERRRVGWLGGLV